MSEAALLKGDNGKIKVEIFGYEYPTATDVDDSNWLQSRLETTGGPFSGSIAISLTTSELMQLHQQFAEVTKHLNGNIRFENLESNWILNLVHPFLPYFECLAMIFCLLSKFLYIQIKILLRCNCFL